MNLDQIISFLDSYIEKTLQPTYRSEDVSNISSENNIEKLYGSNFNEYFSKAVKHTLILWYAPWCKNSNVFQSIYN